MSSHALAGRLRDTVATVAGAAAGRMMAADFEGMPTATTAGATAAAGLLPTSLKANKGEPEGTKNKKEHLRRKS